MGLRLGWTRWLVAASCGVRREGHLRRLAGCSTRSPRCSRSSPLMVRQLIGDPPRLTLRGVRVWVCENPSIIALAADALGDRCPPLICTGGQPSTAVTTLLRQVVGRGAGLAYHSDFDWPGVHMTTSMVRRYAAEPWRMGASDYLAAAERSRRPLAGRPVPAAWDDALMEAMADRGVRVEEELVADELLGDLRAY